MLHEILQENFSNDFVPKLAVCTNHDMDITWEIFPYMKGQFMKFVKKIQFRKKLFSVAV